MPHIKFYSEKKKVLYIELDVFERIKGVFYSNLTFITDKCFQFNFFFLDRCLIIIIFILGKIISPGAYTYPFHFVLPEDLPSTFESSIAKVNYCIKMKSQGMWGPKKVTPFVVLGNVNINHIEKYLVSFLFLLVICQQN